MVTQTQHTASSGWRIRAHSSVQNQAMTTNSLWLDAFSSSSAQLKSDYGVVLLALEDLAVDGCDRLVALIIGQPTLLKVMKGPDIQTEIVLDHLATTMCTFYLDPTSPGIPIETSINIYVVSLGWKLS